MLMFENGLVASFIPEILMVLGFLFCLIFPGFKTEKSIENIHSAEIQVAVSQQITTSVYYFSNHNTQPVQAIENELTSQVCPFFKTLHSVSQFTFQIKDGLSHVQFSRPPPTL